MEPHILTDGDSDADADAETEGDGDRDAEADVDEDRDMICEQDGDEQELSLELAVNDPTGPRMLIVDYSGGPGTPLCSPPGASPFPFPGDANVDGCIDNADLDIILEEWGQLGPRLDADCNRDGFVDAADFSQVLVHWCSCPGL